MAKVRVQPGGLAVIGIVVLGALLFLFFEFKPAGKRPQPAKPAELPAVTKPAPAPTHKASAETGEVTRKVEKEPAPVVTRTPVPEKRGTNVPVRIFFAFNKAHINKNVYCIFDRIQSIVRRDGSGGIRIVVEGNADSIGAPWYNVKLSRRRAARVADSLSQRLGIPLKNISLVANGSGKPIASNKTAAGRADNRRTDILIYH